MPVTDPLIEHAPLAPLLYVNRLPAGAVEGQEIVISITGVKAAMAAGSTVMVREAVIVRPQGSI